MRRWPAILTAVAAVAMATACSAQEPAPGPASPWSGTWGLDLEASSAALARDGWRFMGLATMSWPDGRQAVVTMWTSPLGDFARCFDYFDAALEQTGGKCERSGTGL